MATKTTFLSPGKPENTKGRPVVPFRKYYKQ
jgi:hypothetical protein